MQSADKIKRDFNPSNHLVVHWDGKLLPDLTDGGDGKLNKTLLSFLLYCICVGDTLMLCCAGKKVDHLPVLVSGGGETQLLGVPKLPAGTGLAQANAVYDCVVDWGLVKRIVGACFDTPNTNTGLTAGTCLFLEQKLQTELLHFACRHHVYEVVAKTAFEDCFDQPSTSPNIPLFEDFKKTWSSLDHGTNYFIRTPFLRILEIHSPIHYIKFDLFRSFPDGSNGSIVT